MKFYAHGKFRVLLSGPEKYMPDVMEALERGGCNVFAKIDRAVMREKLAEKGIPENLIEEYLDKVIRIRFPFGKYQEEKQAFRHSSCTPK